MTRLRWAGAAAVLLGSAALAAAFPGVRRAVRGAVREVRAATVLRERAALPPEEPPLVRLAASQVGYGPRLRKRFTSPKPFASFSVVDVPGGSVAFRGGAPVRSVPTDVLGAARTAWIGDFTPLHRFGRYRIVADNGLTSHPFAVGPDVFDAPVLAVERAFYFQRAFTAVDARYARGPWTHASDADRAPPGERGGWHDAGDLSIYNASATTALSWLLQAWRDFAPAADDTGIPESGNGVPDLLDEARWGLSWMLSVQEPSGGFRNTTCQERYGPYGTNFPEGAAPYRSGEVGSVATARAVGTLAQAAAAFRPFDGAFAAGCLSAARRGWAWLVAHPGEASDGPTCPALRQDGDVRAGREARAYAAAGLLLRLADELRALMVSARLLRARRALGAGVERVHFQRSHDPANAWKTGLRTFGTMIALSGIWIATAWPSGGTAMLVATVFSALMAIAPNPVDALTQTLSGFAIAAVLAIVIAALLPGGGFPGLVAVTLPVLAVLFYLGTRPRWAGVGMGALLGMFLNLQITNPMRLSTIGLFNGAVAEIVGLLAAVMGFALLPVRGSMRRALARLRATVDLAASAPLEGLASRFESMHRDLLSQLLRQTATGGHQVDRIVSWSLVTQEVARALIELRQDLRDHAPPAPVRIRCDAVVDAVAALFRSAAPDREAALEAIGRALDATPPAPLRAHLMQLRIALQDPRAPIFLRAPLAPVSHASRI